jgi:hypothetical protein
VAARSVIAGQGAGWGWGRLGPGRVEPGGGDIVADAAKGDRFDCGDFHAFLPVSGRRFGDRGTGVTDPLGAILVRLEQRHAYRAEPEQGSRNLVQRGCGGWVLPRVPTFLLLLYPDPAHKQTFPREGLGLWARYGILWTESSGVQTPGGMPLAGGGTAVNPNSF